MTASPDCVPKLCALCFSKKNKTYTYLNKQNAKPLADNVKRGGERGGGRKCLTKLTRKSLEKANPA